MLKHLKLQALILLAAATGLITGCAPTVASLKSGSVSMLKQPQNVNLEYVYDGMRVGKFINDQDYVNKKVAELNAKEAGRGDTWQKAWLDDRTRRFQPKFEELINRHASEGGGLKFGAFAEAKYTLVFKTTFMEPGWNVGIMRSPAFIDAEASFAETQNRQNTVAVVTISKSPGADAWGFDFDTGTRVQESYAKAGKELGILIRKQLK